MSAPLPTTGDRRTVPRPHRHYDRSLRARTASFFRGLGPGLITGAADDDPSGISTYSQAGAAFGYGLLWSMVIALPLMAAVQLMCARIGLVAKSGLGSVLRDHYPRWLLLFACGLLLLGNTINIAADLGGMAAAAALLVGWPVIWFVPLFTAAIVALLVFSSYRRMTQVLKWLTLALFAYVAAGILARPNWGDVLIGTVVPHARFGKDYWLTLVAILGTTISPYLFFWQASQEAEEEAVLRKELEGRPPRSLQRELRSARTDVVAGMFFSNLISYFIILTAGATLHPAGLTNVQTAADAAAALTPLAGHAAALLFTIGLVGTGMLGIPVLAGSGAYAVAEAAAWRRGMDQKPRRARNFYALIVVAMVIGMALNFAHLDAIKMLFWAAVLNGLLAPPLIIIILVICNNREVMGAHSNGKPLNILGGLAAVLMSAAVIALVGAVL